MWRDETKTLIELLEVARIYSLLPTSHFNYSESKRNCPIKAFTEKNTEIRRTHNALTELLYRRVNYPFFFSKFEIHSTVTFRSTVHIKGSFIKLIKAEQLPHIGYLPLRIASAPKLLVFLLLNIFWQTLHLFPKLPVSTLDLSIFLKSLVDK